MFLNTKQIKEPEEYNYIIPIDLADDDDYYYLYADLPGKRSRDIRLKFKGDKLSIRVLEEPDEVNPIYDKVCSIQERLHEESERIISFDEPIDTDEKKVDAKLENGVLSVKIKKVNPDIEDDDSNLIPIK